MTQKINLQSQWCAHRHKFNQIQRQVNRTMVELMKMVNAVHLITVGGKEQRQEGEQTYHPCLTLA